jgi:acetolactate synthase small subunit
MSTQLDVPPPQTDRRLLRLAGVPQTLTLEVADRPDVLLRVLTTLRRRQCRIRRVDYAAGDRHRPGRLVVAVEAPPAHAHCVEVWLRSLVDVVSVESGA